MKNVEIPLTLIGLRFHKTCDDAWSTAARIRIVSSDDTLKGLLNNLVDGVRSHTAIDEPECAIRAYNAAALFLDAYGDEDQEIVEIADDVMQSAEQLIKRLEPPGLEMRWFACPKCGREIQLYTYNQSEDTRTLTPNEETAKNEREINTRTVYEYMYLSHLCDGCWQRYISEGK